MTTRGSQTRLASIDLLRAMAIVLMTVVHFVENLAGSWDVGDGLYLGASRYWWLPNGVPAPMFTILSGASYRLWADAQRARGRSDAELAKITVRRGLFLILLGFAFNVLVWMPEDVFNWDILTLIGIATLALDVARRVPAAVTLTACGLLVGLAPPLRVLADYHTAWSAGFFEYELVLGDVVRGCLVTGYFPIFPWLAFPLAGFVAAPLLYGGQPSRRPLVIGGLLVAAAVGLMAARPLMPARLVTTHWLWSMFPPTTPYVLGTMGGVMLLAALLHRSLDASPAGGGRFLGVAGAMSRHSLWLYILHHVAHVWPLWIVGFVTTGDATALWQVAMPASTAICWAVACLGVMAWLAERMDRPGSLSVESLLRWLCEP